MKKISLFVVAMLTLMPLQAHEENFENCFGIIAGRLATKDGSVILGHNEDDGGEQMLNMNISPGDPQKGIAKFIWAEFPGMEVADAFMNEYGVSVASDNCKSREDREDYTDGGILFNIRMDVAKYAKTAREAVSIIGKNVEKYGYRSSGRSYLVADTKEGWVVSLVQGRHWVAQRVPDDKVMSIPNYYVIGEVDLDDTENFAGSKDVITYAIERGWYDPAKDGKFNFRRAYASDATMTRASNLNRHSRVIASFTGGKYNYDVKTVDFAVTPDRKVGVQDIINALNIHMEPAADGTEQACVCTNVTILSVVCHMRGWMPKETGCLMWACPGRPCTHPYVPWHLGMTQSPKGWMRYATWQEAEKNHFTDGKDKPQRFPKAAYWKYVNKMNDLGKHQEKNGAYRAELQKKQEKLFEIQKAFEKKIEGLSGEKLSKALNAHTASLVKKY